MSNEIIPISSEVDIRCQNGLFPKQEENIVRLLRMINQASTPTEKAPWLLMLDEETDVLLSCVNYEDHLDCRLCHTFAVSSRKGVSPTAGNEIVEKAKEQMAQITRLKADTISGLIKDEKGWHVNLELVEMRRIPEANDLLATYEVLLDEKGNLIHYQRTKRYLRGQTSESEG